MKKLILFLLSSLAILYLTACSSPVLTKDTYAQGETPKNTDSTINIQTFAPEQKINNTVYPAYIIKDGQRTWGFINNSGNFIIQPQYEWASDFQENCLYMVSKQGKEGLIDRNGSIIVEPMYSIIYNFSEGIATAQKADGSYCTIDMSGKVIFNSKGFIGEFHDGIAVLEQKSSDDTILYGYVNKDGKTIIKPQFKLVYPFTNHEALVEIEDGEYALIDETGNIKTKFSYKNLYNLSEGTLVYTNEKNLQGYIKTDGQPLIDAKFSYAGPFEDGLAVVSTPINNFESRYGVINMSGTYIIKPDYTFIRTLGEGMFAASFNPLIVSEDNLAKKAIFNKEGVMLTDFKYYDIDGFKDGITSVSEDTTTYFIDKNGKKIKNLPEVNGTGVLKVLDGLIKADVDNLLMYITTDGNTIWSPDLTQRLLCGAQVNTLKYNPDRCMLIYYPEISNLPDKKVEDSINLTLKKNFVGKDPVSAKDNGMYTESINIGFSLNDNNNLISVTKDGYCYPIGAAHGMPSKEYLHFDIKSGYFYKLEDLFKDGSDYLNQLSTIINKKIEESSKSDDSMYFPDASVQITPDQQFTVTKDTLKIVFPPYDIAPYAAGFPEFDIPYSELTSIIDTDGNFWNALNSEL